MIKNYANGIFVSGAMDAIEAFEFVMRINQNLYGNLFDADEQTMSDVVSDVCFASGVTETTVGR